MIDGSSPQRFFVCEVESSLSRIQRLQINAYRQKSRGLRHDVVWRAPGPMEIQALVKGLLDDVSSLNRVITFVKSTDTSVRSVKGSPRLYCRATILQYMICCLQFQSAFAILRAGASPNVGLDTDLPSPLQLALELREVSLARELLARGASPGLAANRHGTILTNHSLWLRLGPRGIIDHGKGPSLPGLLRAVELGSLELVDDFLKYGADINEPLPKGVTASVLTLALEAGNLRMARHLLALGALVTMPAPLAYSEMALRRTAALRGDNRWAHNSRQTENTPDDHDDSEQDSYTSSISGLIALVKAGALDSDLQGSSEDANAVEYAQDGCRLTPLTVAMGALAQKHHNHKLAHRLIHLGADVSITKASPSPIEVALAWRCLDCLAMLCDHGLRLDRPKIIGIAAATGSTAVIKRVIELSVITGAPLRSGDGTTSMRHDLASVALQGALLSNNLDEFCKLFLSGYLGVTIDFTAPCLVGVMELACKSASGIKEITQKLGVLLDLRTPFRDESQSSRFACCKFARYASQDQHAAECREPRKSCLMRAIKSNRLDIVELLLARYAELASGSQVGTGLDCKILGELETALVYACKQDRVDIIRALIKAGASPISSRAGTDNNSPLQEAAQHGKLAAVRFLLRELKISVEHTASEHEGFTALQLAAANGHVSVVCELVRAGADIHSRHGSGQTALELAVKYDRSCVVQHLLVSGADIGQSEFGQEQFNNCIALAAKSRNSPLAELIRQKRTESQDLDESGEALDDEIFPAGANPSHASREAAGVCTPATDQDCVLVNVDTSNLLEEALLARTRSLRIG